MKTLPVLSVSLLLCATAASAADADTPAPAGAPPAMTMPKPAPELAQLDWMAGSWRCAGKAPAGPLGPERTYKATFTFSKVLGDFWRSGEYHQQKSKTNPIPMHAHGFFTWDPSTKTFTGVAPDSSGGYAVERISWDGTTWTGAGDEIMGGQKLPVRETIVKTADNGRALTWKGEIKMGANWIVIGEDSCQK